MRAPLKPGENSIAGTRPKKQRSGKWRGRFSVRLMNGKVVRLVATGATIGEFRSKAEAAAADLLKSTGTEGAWKPTSPMSEYIARVSIPLVSESKRLRPRTRTNYETTLKTLETEFTGYSIRDSVRFRRMEAVLKGIAQERGHEAARQARNCLSKYVIQQLIRDELIDANPLAGMAIDLGESTKKRGGQALTEAQYSRVVEYLLDADPKEAIEAPKRGRYRKEDRIRLRQALIEITLLQATTGLRINEALTLQAKDTNERDGLWITVTAEKSKTHRARTVPVLDSRAAKRIALRINGLAPTQLVFPSPATGESAWDQSNIHKRLRGFYSELAERCEIPLLTEVSTHVWRATLSTIAMNRGVPAEVRAAYFGHTVEVNREAYTDTTSVDSLISTFQKR